MRFGKTRARSLEQLTRLLAAALVVAGLLGGCASRSPYRQEFVELRTGNFILTSSLSPDATTEFALQLELFHAGVRALLGLSDDPAPTLPTPVYVFDDRSLGRPFAVQNEAAYLLDEVEAPILVFRGGRDFAARMTPDLRHRYAHRVLRDHAKQERPLWYEEGVAQLARTLDETSKGVVVGRLAPEFQQSVFDWRRGDLLGSLQRSDLSDATPPERVRFEAQTWAIAHTLEFEDRPASGSPTHLSAYRSALNAPDAATRDGAFAALGISPEALEKRIYKHLEQRRPKVRLLQIHGLQMSRWKPVSLSLSESRARLGELALRLERPELALEYFERALASDPQHAAARIGRAVAAARLGQPEVVDSSFETTQLPPDAAAALYVSAGDAYRAVAEQSDSPERRRAALATARARYAEALAGAQPAVRAALGMALTYLDVEGEDPAEALEWLARVRASRRGSLALELWIARAEDASGQARLARIRARNVVSRTHDRALEESARGLIESGASDESGGR